MLKPLLLLPLFFTNVIYGQDSLKEIVSKGIVAAAWDQLLIFKKEWKQVSLIEMKGDKVKKIQNCQNQGSIIFSPDSFKIRSAYPNAAADYWIEYLENQKYFLATKGTRPGTKIVSVDLPYKVYALDSTYLVIEYIQDYFSFVKQTNYQQKPADTTNTGQNYFRLDKPIGAGRIDINFGGRNRKILMVYRAAE